ncbi:MAG: Rpn family recombination-promoting nuclease/putative transposase, partial [Okeania sp. SIO4D6]|nr:Rpn family recombination-promoting nuclease/putative transposase [Okeania sp. SIO4D6]
AYSHVFLIAKAYANQLETGEDYLLLNPAIAVTITDFILFEKKDNFINKFVFKEETKNFECLDKQLRLIFLELPKFKKGLSELNSLTDKWIYFLKEATRLDSIPENLGEVSEIEKALNIANRINMTVEELDILERRAIAMQDERGRIIYAEEQGKLNQAIAIVMRLLKKRFGEIPATINDRVKDLLLSDLESLTEDILDFNSLEDLESWLQER